MISDNWVVKCHCCNKSFNLEDYDKISQERFLRLNFCIECQDKVIPGIYCDNCEVMWKASEIGDGNICLRCNTEDKSNYPRVMICCACDKSFVYRVGIYEGICEFTGGKHIA